MDTTLPRAMPRMLLFCGLAAAVGGCASPIAPRTEADLRRSVVEAVRREMTEAERDPTRRATTRSADAQPLPIPPHLMAELEQMSGPGSRNVAATPLTADLMGLPQRTVAVSLERAVRSAVENNLEVQFARLAPAIVQSQIVAAEAAFDWTFFSNLQWTNQDQMRPSQASSGFPIGTGLDQRQIVESSTGLRRQLTSGGRLTVQQDLIYTDFATPGQSFTPDPATTLTVSAQIDQPLLRNFGSDVALAQVRLSRNAERNTVADLRRDLIRLTNDTERAYWELVRAHHDVAILLRLLERGEQVRDMLRIRQEEGLDARPANVAEAIARVERRKSDVIAAQVTLRQASNRLKVLMNDPDLTVGSEVLVLPVDQPIDAPMEFSLLEALSTALSQRPEIEQAVISIDDTSIRQVVAANQRLPQLDMRGQIRFHAMDDDLSVYDSVFDGKFVDYIVGLFFEQPIGNRAAEAGFRQRRLERMQAVISYRNTVQGIVREVKDALDSVTLYYQLIAQTRLSRIASAESLRALQVENELLTGLTAERLALELNQQESLAAAERAEMEALTNFNASISQYHAAVGTNLERNRIEFVVPNADEALSGRTRGRAHAESE